LEIISIFSSALEADYQKRSRNKQELEKPKYDQYE
jgi:hypothetical protein